MKRKMISSILLLSTLTLLLSGCNKEPEFEPAPDVYIATEFNVDSSIIKHENEIDFINSWKSNKDFEIVDDNNAPAHEMPTYSVSEIILSNLDKSTDYIVDGNDIVYKERRFIGLNNMVNAIEIPYDLNTFINFIVKTYEYSGDSNIICELYIDDLSAIDNVSQGEGYYVPISESLMERDGYIDICLKYDDEANWSISLHNENSNNLSVLSGCKSFVIYNGPNEINIDMSEYDTDLYENNEETSEDIENTDEIQEDTESTEEDTESNEEDTESNEEESANQDIDTEYTELESEEINE